MKLSDQWSRKLKINIISESKSSTISKEKIMREDEVEWSIGIGSNVMFKHDKSELNLTNLTDLIGESNI